MKPSDFMESAAPEDMTVGVMRGFMLREPALIALQKFYPDITIKVKYRHSGKDVHDDMTLKAMRELVEMKRVVVSIDDGSGGQLEEA